MKAIVAADENWGIGKNGDQLVYIPADLKRFQQLTTGHTILLGRKTLSTFPGGRPLKNRRNLILSRDSTFAPEGGEGFSSLSDALSATDEDTFVVGGAEVYRQCLPYCDTVYATKIHRQFASDCFFPNLETDPDWEITETEGPFSYYDLTFTYQTWQRISHIPQCSPQESCQIIKE